MDIQKLFQKKPRVAVIGDFMLDEYLWGEAERISPEEPVPVVRFSRREVMPGGAGNVARNLAELGARVFACGVVGEDAAGKELRAFLKTSGINTAGLIASRDFRTIVKRRIMATRRQLIRFDEEEPLRMKKMREKELIRVITGVTAGADAVAFSDYAKGTITAYIARNVIAQARKQKIPVIADAKPETYHIYRGVAVCTPNIKEALLLVGKPLPTELVGKTLLKKFAGSMVITEGERGMTLFEKGSKKSIHYPAYQPKKVFDVTGAGDTVVAALAFGLGTGLSLQNSAYLANIAAGIVVGKPGTAAVSREELFASLSPQHAKIKRGRDLGALVNELHVQKRTIVLATGCFDILHSGHLELFSHAKSLGDVLVVGVNTDASVRRIKGKERPLIPEEDRLFNLASLMSVDYVTSFPELTPVKLIQKVKPHVFVKGSDWHRKRIPEARVIKSYGGRIVFYEKTKAISTTDIIRKIRNPKFEI